jgi:hypothetical protein
MTRVFRMVVAVTFAAASAVTPPAAAHRVAEPRATGWVIERTGSGGAPIASEITFRGRRAGAHGVVFGLAGRGAARRLAVVAWTFVLGSDLWVQSYGQPFATPDCVSVACADPLLLRPLTFESGSGGRPVSASIYVAGWDVRIAVKMTTPGWRVRPWQPTIRVVRMVDAGGSGLVVADMMKGSFEHAEAAGGPYGSFAYAELPCGERGTGRARFTGGARTWDLSCGGAFQAVPEYAALGTRWRVHGHVEGEGHHTNALVVVDWPR